MKQELTRNEWLSASRKWWSGILAFFFVWVVGLWSEDELRFRHITLEQGLSQLTISSIARDRVGFMWFGTQDGLNKYDGSTFRVYRNNPYDKNSLPDDNIRSMYFDNEEGVLWIGTRSGGLAKFSPETEIFTRYQHNAQEAGSLGNDEVCALYKDRQGVLWAGTWGGGLNRFNRKQQTFQKYRHDHNDRRSISSDIVRVIFEDKEGVMWIGTYGAGLNRFDRKSGQFDPIRFEPSPGGLNGEVDNVMDIAQTMDGQLWLATDYQGLIRYNPKSGEWRRFLHEPGKPGGLSHNRIRVIHEDRTGQLWIGTYGGGINLYDYQSETFTVYRKEVHGFYSLNSDEILSIYEDQFDIVWVGTNSGGINKYDRKLKKFKHYGNIPDEPNSLSEPKVRAIYEDRDGITWIGTTGGGLNRLDRARHRYTHYKNEPKSRQLINSNFVYAICPDDTNEDILWIGTYGAGLDKFDKQKGVVVKNYRPDPGNPNSISHERIRRIITDHHGTLWIGTWNGGLNRFDTVSGQFYIYRHIPGQVGSISHDYILTVYIDRRDQLWVGTWGGGLNLYNGKTDSFSVFKHQPLDGNSLSNDKVHCIYEDNQGIYWIGTDKGLNRFDRAVNQWRCYSVEEGLANDIVYSVIEDDEGNLWLSTNKGLSRFNREIQVFKNYGIEDGLRNSEYNGGAYFKSSSGEIFFGGLDGFISFFPHEIRDNPFIPPLIITDFKIFNKSKMFNRPLSMIKEVNLTYKDNYFSIDFVALNYRSSENNQYAYKLEGFDRDWIYCQDQKTASYTNLDGGTYIFRVKGSNNDDVWNDEGATLRIVISPPFWKTWWFQVVMVLLSIVLITMGYHFRLYATRRKNRELGELNHRLSEQIEERRQIEEALQASEEKFRKLFENSIDVHYRADMQGKLLMITPSGRHLLGYDSIDEMVGKNIPGEFYANPQDHELFEKILLKQHKITHFEIRLRRKDNEIVVVEISARLVLDNEGQPEAVEGIMRDITTRKRAEEENYRLQNQLLSAKKIEAVGTLAGGMAHEFNNLIAVINGNAQMLIELEDKRSYSFKRLKAIVNAGERCATLTNQLLSFSRKQMLKLKQLNLNDLVLDIEDAIRRILGDKNRLQIALEANPGDINVDSEMMIQVILGMVNNARDAMVEGGTLSISTKTVEFKRSLQYPSPDEREGIYVCLVISDDGMGMDEEVLQHIFEPFFTTKQVGKGIGLDLSFVYGTITQHKGWIEVESEPGKGATFRIYLPHYLYHTSEDAFIPAEKG